MPNIKTYQQFHKLNESLLDKTYYHGTAEEFNQFNTELFSKGVGHDDQGAGIYLTDEIAVAKFFSHIARKKMYMHQGMKMGKASREAPSQTPEQKAELERKFDEIDSKLNSVATGFILTIKLAPDTKLLDIDNDNLSPEQVDKVLVAAAISPPTQPKQLDKPVNLVKYINRMNRELYINKTDIKSAEQFVAVTLGYDGIKLLDQNMNNIDFWQEDFGTYEPELPTTTVIYNASKVKVDKKIADPTYVDKSKARKPGIPTPKGRYIKDKLYPYDNYPGMDVYKE